MSSSKNMSSKELFEMAKEEAFGDRDGECPICFECPYDEPLQTPCRHIFCRECIVGYLQTKSECPMCRAKVKVPQLKQPKDPNATEDTENDGEEKKSENSEDSEDGENGAKDKEPESIRFDAKMNRLISELQRIRRDRPNDKSLIFTSFTKSLKWMTSELERNGFGYRTLSGDMSMNKRKKQLDQFANDDNVKVFVLTVRSGAVGITLTAANHVFMMEPPFNPALYRQAINRAYRLGQKKKVFIYSMIMRDSIEHRIWNINKEKQSGVGKDESAAGNISGDKKANLKQNEITQLFSDDVDSGAAANEEVEERAQVVSG